MDEKIKATVSAAVVLVVSVLAMYGIDVDGDLAVNIALTVLGAVVVFYGCWKNHNWTDAAAAAQRYMEWLKDGAVEYDYILDAHGENGDADEE